MISHLKELIKVVNEAKEGREGDIILYNIVQKMFFISDSFDKAIIYMIRCMTKNFLLEYKDRSLNELPFNLMILGDADSLEQYIDNIVMKMDEDAIGALLFIMPIVLRINIYIVNLDISQKQRVNYILIYF